MGHRPAPPRRRAGTTCKFSGLVAEAGADWDATALRPYVDVVLDAFGSNQLMFGSDWPVCLLASMYERWIAAVHEPLADLPYRRARRRPRRYCAPDLPALVLLSHC